MKIVGILTLLFHVHLTFGINKECSVYPVRFKDPIKMSYRSFASSIDLKLFKNKAQVLQFASNIIATKYAMPSQDKSILSEHLKNYFSSVNLNALEINNKDLVSFIYCSES